MDHSAMDHAASADVEHAGHGGMTGALGSYPMTRESSGTAWQPDNSRHMGWMGASGDWMLMGHGVLNLVYSTQGGPRGDDKAFASGMLMGMASRPVGDGRLGVRGDLGPTDTLRLGELQELAVRGRQTRTGAIVGGIAGVAVGIFVGVMVNGLCETDDCEGARPYLISIPAFGAGGALLGAAVGSAFPKWKRVFP